MKFKEFVLDRFQEEAIERIDKGDSVVVSAPTGSGKTLIADYIIGKEIKNNARIIYTAPIKALSNQKYKDFVAEYGEDRIGLITGDVVINHDAQVLIMTTEVYRNMAIMRDAMLDPVSYVIMDEIHYLGDYERGYIWEESIIFSPLHVRFLFLSATIPNSEQLAGWVERIKKHKVSVVRHTERPVPLRIAFYDADLGICSLRDIRARKELDRYPRYENASSRRRFFRQSRAPRAKPSQVVSDLKGKLPCIFFVFSRAKCQEYAIGLAKQSSYLSAEESKAVSSEIAARFAELSAEVRGLNSSRELRECLSKGIAFHHAGLLPDLKTIVEQLFGAGLVKVLFATETFAVGINMPARAVVFDSLRKYTDSGFRYLNSKEFFQISGRAGRRGIDNEGLSVSVVSRDFDDLKKIESFTKRDDLPIMSQFRISPNTVLNMINLHTPEEIERILKMNFYTYQQLGRKDEGKVLGSIQSRYEKLSRLLGKMGYVKDGKLTSLGIFTTHIFSHEIEISQLFCTDFELDEYLTMLVIASLEYEERKEAKIYETFSSREADRLVRRIKSHPYLKKGVWTRHFDSMSGIVRPLCDGKSFVEIMQNTSMLEGDIVRILMRILDKLEQIDRALDTEPSKQTVRNCKSLVKACLKGIHLF